MRVDDETKRWLEVGVLMVPAILIPSAILAWLFS